MGPRLFSRGKDAHREHWGSGVAASMGPRLFSRGKNSYRSVKITGEGRFNGAAAVQPRKDLEFIDFDAAGLASMGPRLFSRGKRCPRTWPRPPKSLQWGRGCSAAESYILWY